MKKEYLKPTMEIIDSLGCELLTASLGVFDETITSGEMLAPSLEEELF